MSFDLYLINGYIPVNIGLMLPQSKVIHLNHATLNA